jgi:hypothetical protein
MVRAQHWVVAMSAEAVTESLLLITIFSAVGK